MSRKILIDIGSTYTKVVVVDIASESIIAAAKSPTTVETDITIGLEKALKMVERAIGSVDDVEMIACCSAAGGLRMVSVGLVPELSAEAAKRAALGAGAKIVGHYSHQLTAAEIARIEETRPDIILLAGGTDGGNERTIVHNAGVLAGSSLSAPIVVAGNKCAYDEIERIFKAAAKTYQLVGNVMPDIGRLEVDACRNAIREVFINNIVKAKGLDKAKALLGNIIMATPVAVLNAAVLLSQGVEGEEGLGEIIVVDVGGATTDVYSIASGAPVNGAATLRGLPEPFAKRTVEGDLGVRHNIDTLVEICRAQGLDIDHEASSAFRANPGTLPLSERERAADAELARIAVQTSFERHVGRLEAVYGPHGEMFAQVGKDLRKVRKVIGTGGPVIHCECPATVLAGVLGGGGNANLLKPEEADLYLDRSYVIYALGLLAQSEPKVALRIMKKGLEQLGGRQRGGWPQVKQSAAPAR